MINDYVTVDFEAYFDKDYTLNSMGSAEFVMDPRFELVGAGVQKKGGKSEFFWGEADVIDVLTAFGVEEEDGPWVSYHQGFFDDTVMLRRLGLKPARIVDTLFLARQVLGGKRSSSVKILSKLFGLPEKGNTNQFKGLSLSEILGDPDVKQAMIDYCNRDVENQTRFLEYFLPRLTNAQQELALGQHSIRTYSDPANNVHADPVLLQEIVDDASSELDLLLKDADATAKEIGGNISFAELLEQALIKTGRRIPQKPNVKGKLINALAKKDEAFKALLDDEDPRVRGLCRARTGIRPAQQTASRMQALKTLHDLTGKVPIQLNLHGAITGRWTGGGGINFQNMRRDGRDRNVVVPAPGNVFVIGDSAQIEARVCALISGETELINAFYSGADPYCALASVMFGRTVTKDDVLERGVSKESILSNQFGAGALKSYNTLRAKPGLEDLTPATARGWWDAYRKRYANIVGTWGKLECDMFNLSRGLLTYSKYWSTINTFDTPGILLPSGRKQAYVNLREENEEARTLDVLDKNGDMRKYHMRGAVGLTYGVGDEKYHLHAGMIMENVCSGISRDCLAGPLLSMEAAGYPIRFHVHDELIAEVEEKRAEDCKQYMNFLLSMSPSWMLDLPLAAEVRIATCYGKD